MFVRFSATNSLKNADGPKEMMGVSHSTYEHFLSLTSSVLAQFPNFCIELAFSVERRVRSHVTQVALMLYRGLTCAHLGSTRVGPPRQ
jgi:hypothetical protein